MTFPNALPGSRPYAHRISNAIQDRNGRTPEDVVVAYLTLRREWDISTYERVTGVERTEPIDPDRPLPFDQNALGTALAELERLRQDWCTPAAAARIDRRASFGNTSPFNPDGLTFVDVHRVSENDVAIRTHEFPFDEDGPALPPIKCEYVVRSLNDEWRIDSRVADGIHDLLY